MLSYAVSDSNPNPNPIYSYATIKEEILHVSHTQTNIWYSAIFVKYVRLNPLTLAYIQIYVAVHL